MTSKQLVITAGILVLATPAVPHGGGLDRNGCHTNRKTGEYHCHRGAAPRRAPAPRATPTPRSNTPSPLLGRSAGSIRLERSGPPITEAELIIALQLLLASLGHEAGDADGQLGAQTIDAIRQFQSQNHLPADGKPNGKLLVRLSRAVFARRAQ